MRYTYKIKIKIYITLNLNYKNILFVYYKYNEFNILSCSLNTYIGYITNGKIN